MKSFGNARAAVWDVPFRDGKNILEARGSAGGKPISDRAEVQFSLRPQSLKNASAPFTQLAVNVGSGSQFIDDAGLVWEADQPYSPGGWGFIGGAEDKTDQNILGTTDDPLYRSFRKGIERYRFDVPDGNYEVELRFAEPRYTRAGEHLFSISANGQRLVEQLDLSKEYGAWHAASRTVKVAAIGGQGVELQFQPVKGETVLSAIRLRRLP
jgi:beta-galactosidase